MENVLEWTNLLDSKRRSKPNKSLQQELLCRIRESLREDATSCADCLNALMKFDRGVLESFYREDYPQFTNSMQNQWDKALAYWADNAKPTEKVAIRISTIIREKLQYMPDVNGIMTELRWLSLHDNKDLMRACMIIQRTSASVNLQKLLMLDMTTWSCGKEQIKKLYHIIFLENQNPTTQKMYDDFLIRHGWLVSTSSDKPAEPKAQVDIPDVPHHDTSPVGQQDGIALAEALLKWCKEQQETLCEQTTLLTTMRQNAQTMGEQIHLLNERVASLDQALSEEVLQKQNALQAQQDLQTHVSKLEEEIAQANDKIGRLQQMSENTLKQELDGFRHNLANELHKTVSDFQVDVSDLPEAEQAEVYKALFDELIDTLKHHGISIEVS